MSINTFFRIGSLTISGLLLAGVLVATLQLQESHPLMRAAVARIEPKGLLEVGEGFVRPVQFLKRDAEVAMRNRVVGLAVEGLLPAPSAPHFSHDRPDL